MTCHLVPSDRVFLFIEKSVNNFYLKSFQSSHCFLVQLRIEAGAELVVHDDLCLRIPGLEVADVGQHTHIGDQATHLDNVDAIRQLQQPLRWTSKGDFVLSQDGTPNRVCIPAPEHLLWK